MTRPTIEIINADATDEEIAAIVIALASLAPAAVPTRRTSNWAAPARAVRRPLYPGVDQWRSSNLPR